MRSSHVLAVAACVAALSACKSKTPSRDTPEGALEAFFHALDHEKFPAELDQHIVDDVELSSWRMRCRMRTCAGGSFEIVDSDKTAYHATLYTDYVIKSERGVTLARGQRAPIMLEKRGSEWRIAQFGERRQFRPGSASDGGPEGSGDGGARTRTPRDGGPGSEAERGEE